MISSNYKKCHCNISDCGKCLTLNCTDDSCSIHRLITKWRYRKRLLESFRNSVGKWCTDYSCRIHRIVTKKWYIKYPLIGLRSMVGGLKSKREAVTLQNDIKTCEEEIKRLSEVMGIKQ
ncbi:MAG: hypothetical protein Q8Q89_03015 [bacterium]|nr:hypothetical protein [bacterium]